MKKLLFLLPVLALCACQENATTDDYATLKAELSANTPQVIATGTMGDFLIKIPETPALKKIASKRKTSKFLSIQNPNSLSAEGYCLVNIIPALTFERLDTPDNTCNYRIYCGAPSSMNYDKFYAVELCDTPAK